MARRGGERCLRRDLGGRRGGERVGGRAVFRLARRALRDSSIAVTPLARDVALLRSRRFPFADRRRHDSLGRRPEARSTRERGRSGSRRRSRGVRFLARHAAARRRGRRHARNRSEETRCRPRALVGRAGDRRGAARFSLAGVHRARARASRRRRGQEHGVSVGARGARQAAAAVEAGSTPKYRFEVEGLVRLSYAWSNR